MSSGSMMLCALNPTFALLIATGLLIESSLCAESAASHEAAGRSYLNVKRPFHRDGGKGPRCSLEYHECSEWSDNPGNMFFVKLPNGSDPVLVSCAREASVLWPRCEAKIARLAKTLLEKSRARNRSAVTHDKLDKHATENSRERLGHLGAIYEPVLKSKDGSMNTDELMLFTEQDLEQCLTNPRFLAAAHVYSMDKIPLGEAMVRAVRGPPYLPSRFANQSRAYEQLIHEVAERIAHGKIEAPARLAHEYPEVYADYVGPSWWSKEPYLGSSGLHFSELRSSEARKKAFALYRSSFTEADIAEISTDERMLACIDAYGKNLMTYRTAAQLMYGGDQSAVPLDLSFSAFHALVLEAVNRIKRTEIKVSPDLEQRFSNIYSTRDAPDRSNKR